MKVDSINPEHRTIVDWVREGSSVLDLGCGDGDLLSLLVKEKRVRAQGIEARDQGVFCCVSKGLSVLHGDVESGLSEYGEKSFDYTILNKSMQKAVRRADYVIHESLRVSEKVILSFSNFAHYKARFQIFLMGRTPITESLPYEWYDTPNLHFLSTLDFVDYCRKEKIEIERSAFLGIKREVRVFANLFALTGIYLISKKTK